MRSFLPYVLIFLAIFVAACIAYIAWELSAEQKSGTEPTPGDADDPPASR